MNTNTTFCRPADVLPRWMGFRSAAGQFGPVNVPVFRPQQLTIEYAIGGAFDQRAHADGRAVFEPVVDGLSCDSHQVSKSLLPTKLKNGALQRCTMKSHVDIVAKKLTTSQQNSSLSVQKLGMTVWKNIAEELHRRRKPNKWLGEQLGETRQVISGWKRRGVPAKDYERIATLFGWSLDKLVKGEETEEAAAAPTTSSQAAPAAPPAESAYSPMALDAARMLDRIPDIEHKRRAYALIVQITALDSAPSPIVPAPPTAAPDAAPTPTPHRVK